MIYPPLNAGAEQGLPGGTSGNGPESQEKMVRMKGERLSARYRGEHCNLVALADQD
jgi:hypothetical protein